METLINVWNTYKSEIIPVLITVFVTVLPAIGLYLASRLKTKAAREEAQAEKINELASREDTREELDANTKSIEELKNNIEALSVAVTNLADLFNAAFQSSSLPVEVKEKLDNITVKIKSGTSPEVVASLKDEIDKYKDLYDNVVEELRLANEKINEKKTIKRARV